MCTIYLWNMTVGPAVPCTLSALAVTPTVIASVGDQNFITVVDSLCCANCNPDHTVYLNAIGDCIETFAAVVDKSRYISLLVRVDV